MSQTFKPIGIGIVAADKNDNSPFISVYIQEKLSDYKGEVSSQVVTKKVKVTDSDGNKEHVFLQRGITVKAEWLKSGNRLTAPCVKKGEEVELLEVVGADRYRWKELGENSHLRRQEKITMAFGASETPVDKNKPVNPKDFYTMEVDGKNGNVTFKTTQANKELAGYTVQLNGKSGQLSITDTEGNLFQINSVKKTISCKNKDGTLLQLNGKNLTVLVPEELSIKAKTIKIEANTINVKGQVTFENNVTIKEKLTAKNGTINDLNGNNIVYSHYTGDNV